METLRPPDPAVCPKFYGVLPARVDFLRWYTAFRSKDGAVGDGADDEAVARAMPRRTESARARYGIGQKDFLVMTGKINAKTQTST